jgi:hypothetical protein
MIVVQGVALFAFIPFVLWLFLAQPLGPALSVACGVAIMIGHRGVAAPWAARHARDRCLWCGRPGAPSHDVPVTGAAGTIVFGACTAAHANGARRLFGFTDRYRVPIGLGILVPLVVLIGGTLMRAFGVEVLSHDVHALQFRVIVAATVVATSLAYLGAPAAEAPRSAFPVHNLALLGIRNTLWVFRLVGGWWLAAAVIGLVRGSRL